MAQLLIPKYFKCVPDILSHNFNVSFIFSVMLQTLSEVEKCCGTTVRLQTDVDR